MTIVDTPDVPQHDPSKPSPQVLGAPVRRPPSGAPSAEPVAPA